MSNNNDSGAGSFRQALLDLASDPGPSATISFTISSQTITLASDLPTIGNTALTSIVIDGNTNSIDANNHRAYVIGSTLGVAITDVSISALSISNGKALGGTGGLSRFGGGGGGGGGFGGAYFVNGSLALSDSAVSNCSAVGGNGGAGNSGATTTGAAGGGGGSSISSTSSRNGSVGATIYPATGGSGGGDNPGPGGTGSPLMDGGNGGWSGGGGGAGATFPAAGVNGGAGGFGGGGGGGGDGTGADPGGVGGPTSTPTPPAGFGGGGGGAGEWGSGSTKAGGYGGIFGGNGGTTTSPSTNGGAGGGGGGGVGGLFFVYDGGSLSLTRVTSSGGAATGGTAGTGTPGGVNGTGFANGVFLYANASLILNGSMTAGFPIDSTSSLSNDAGVTINSGTVAITQTNSYRGGTFVKNGSTLQVSSDANLGTNTGGITVDNSTFEAGATFTLDANRTTTLVGTAQFSIDSGYTCTIQGNITGTGGALSKTGPGILALNGSSSNTYDGMTTISAGELDLNNSAGVAIPADVLIDGGTLSTLAASQITTGSAMTLSSGSFLMNGHAQEIKSFTYQAGTFTQGGAILTLNNDGIALTMRDTTIAGDIALTGGSSQEIVFDETNNGTATISGNLNLSGNDTNFSIPRGTSSTDMLVSGDIGIGSLIKTGSGILTLLGTNANSSIVNAGTLIINGVNNDTVTVNAGGTLKGAGTINSTVTVYSGGTIQAGNSIGTFTMSALDLLPGANLVLEIAPGDNNSSKYLVTNASLGGANLTVLVDPGSYASTYSYDFITASGAITGTFNPTINVQGSFSAGVVPIVQYYNQLVRLIFTSKIGTGFHFTGNEQALLVYLRSLYNLPALVPTLLDLGLLGEAELAAALDSISPARNAAAFELWTQSILGVREFVVNHLELRRISRRVGQQPLIAKGFLSKDQTLVAMNMQQENLVNPVVSKSDGTSIRTPAVSPKAISAKPNQSDLWASGFGIYLSQCAQNQNPKIKDNAYGAIVGYDYYGSGGIVTLSGSYLANRIQEGSHSGGGQSNGGTLNVYGTGYVSENFYIEAGVLFAGGHFAMHRNVSYGGAAPLNTKTKSKFNIWEIIPHLGGGYDFNLYRGQIVLEPYANIDCAYVAQGKIQETGSSVLNMMTDSKSSAVLRSEVGLNFYKVKETIDNLFICELSGGYVNRTAFNTNTTNALVIATPPPSNGLSSVTLLTYNKVLNLGMCKAELFYKYKPANAYGSIQYEGEMGSGYLTNSFRGTLGFFF